MKTNSHTLRKKRQSRIRAKITGTAARPRLSVFRSRTSLSVQLIDDVAGVTLGSARSANKNVTAAKELGAVIAAVAKEKGITVVVFDRGGYRYHGKIAALADGAREGGLQF